jgi:hypothetical protein
MLNKNCYALQHLTPVEYVVWEICRRLSNGGKHTLRFSGPKIAARLYKMSEPTVRRAARSMEKKGWLILLAPKRRNKPTLYRVLDHSAWSAAHGADECFDADGVSRQRLPVTMECSLATFTSDDMSVKSDSATFTSDDATIKSDVSTIKSDISTFTHDDESGINLVGALVSNLVLNIVPNLVETPTSHSAESLQRDSPTPSPQTAGSADDCPDRPQDEAASPSVPLAALEGWQVDSGFAPVDWLDHLRRPAIVEVPAAVLLDGDA